jgi:hypothetical protein
MFTKLIGPITPTETPAPDRHERKCLICNHPDRDAIEEDFLHWHSPSAIASRFDVTRDSIYRHAHATRLFSRRAGKIRSVLDLIIEQAESAKVTGDTIISAIRAYCCVTDDGRWIEPPPRQVIVTRREELSAVEGLPVMARSSDVESLASNLCRNLIATPTSRNTLNSLAVNETYRSNRNKSGGSAEQKNESDTARD